MSEIAPPFESIRAFVHVAQAGSFTKAARLLDIPKSTLSRWITELEAQLGTQLLLRTTRKLSLTDTGQAYLLRTQDAVSELEKASQAIAALDSVPRGTLRVTVPVDLAVRALSPLYTRFTETYSEVNLVILATNRHVDLVAERVDLALRAGTLPDSSMLSKKLSQGGSSLFASEAYLKRYGSPKTVEELQDHNCLVFGARSEATWRLKSEAGSKELRVRGNLAATDFGVLIEACSAGIGISLLPSSLLQHPSDRAPLVALFPDWQGPAGELHAIYPSTAHLGAKVRVFIDMAVEYFSNPQCQRVRPRRAARGN